MHTEIIHFWFEELTPSQWFAKDEKIDREITDRFGHLHTQAAACELFTWRSSPHGRLAEILILDQFSRNMFRGQAQAFAQDPLALALAQEALARNLDEHLTLDEKRFVYMPFMHSESLAIHDIALQLFRKPGLEHSLEYERKHREILERFGRYPHRNEALGRTSTQEELEFLQQPGSSF